MRSFAVLEPPDPPADRFDRALGLIFLKDGFSWTAALFAPLWMLAHRLWWPFLGYLALGAAIDLSAPLFGMRPYWIGFLFLALNLSIGLEAATLRTWSLARRGWRELAFVTGRSLIDCERRFFEAWLPTQPVLAPGAMEGAEGRHRSWRWGVPFWSKG